MQRITKAALAAGLALAAAGCASGTVGTSASGSGNVVGQCWLAPAVEVAITTTSSLVTVSGFTVTVMLDGKTAYGHHVSLAAANPGGAPGLGVDQSDPLVLAGDPALALPASVLAEVSSLPTNTVNVPITNVGVLYVAKGSRCTVSDITVAGS